MRQSRVNKHNQSKKSNNVWKIIVMALISIITSSVIFLLYYQEDLAIIEKLSIKPSVEETVEQPVSEPEQPATVEEPPPAVEEEPPVIQVDAGGYAVQAVPVTEPTYIDGVLVASKKYPLPKDYHPGEQPEAKTALTQMLAGAKEAGYNLAAFSGFRSYEYQETLYQNYVNRDGQAAADRYSARPGHSEHQTGLAFDIGEQGQEDLWLTEQFGETAAGKWLMDHAHQYGFILRYPKGKEDITGYRYESWHYRYVGVEKATAIKNSSVTLEEYLGIE